MTYSPAFALFFAFTACSASGTGSIPLKDSAPDSMVDSAPDSQSETGFSDGLNWPGEEWEVGDPESVGIDTDAMEELRAYLFRKAHNTQALVVIKDGLLVGEWYTEGKDKDSLVTSWSIAKSVLSAMVGVGLRENILSLEDSVGETVPEWSTGPNKDVTIRNLLEMRSGLDANWSNPNGVYSVITDQLEYSLTRQVEWTPGQTFHYVNEDSMVLGEVVSKSFGEDFQTIAEREVLSPIGLQGDWWKDSDDHTLSYCCIDSTARALARFGLLYSRNGAWKGQQIVPESFLKESTTGISNDGYYGMLWWTYGSVYAALGYDGQYLYVYPEHDLVVARFTNYTKMGNKSVRKGANYHLTDSSGPLDGIALYWLVVGLVDN